LEKNIEYEITLTAHAYGGESIGRLPDGRAVFVPFALPGETVRVTLVEEKRGFARARLLEVLQAAPQRAAPRCAHFMDCGGCHYQHMGYADQLAAKESILRDQLERIGGLRQPPVRPIVASPRPFNYRNHVQFHLTPEGRLGYQRARSEATLAIQECHLPEATLNQVWPQLDFEALAEVERVGLRLGMDDDVQLILESGDPQPPELSVEDLPLSVAHVSPAGTLTLAGSDALFIEVLGRVFRVSAGSFFQVNTAMAAAMVTHVLEYLPRFQPLSPELTLVDAYCGVGLFSAFLAGQVGQLIGIEASPSAAEDFAANLDEFDNVALYESDAALALETLDCRPQVILVDPPRQGIELKALDGLLRLAPYVLVYVSCDPSTLGRDARRLSAAGYALQQVTPFDVFPQTYHVESISFWVRNG
jgi:23S rRNA (uracil1939-C5)-methyltransferase